MTAITATDDRIKVKEDGTGTTTGGRLDLALAMHLAAARFSSPASIAFLPLHHLPFPIRKRD